MGLSLFGYARTKTPGDPCSSTSSQRYLLGILLPVLDTIRRGWGEWSVNFTTMFEDYFADITLVVGAVGAVRGARWAPTWLVVVWSAVMAMMFSNCVSQTEHHFWREPREPHSGSVLAIRLVLLLISALALRYAIRNQTVRHNRLDAHLPERVRIGG